MADLFNGKHPFKVGDTFTLCGQYKRRTFWQWLTRETKQLTVYTVVDGSTSGPGGYLMYLDGINDG